MEWVARGRIGREGEGKQRGINSGDAERKGEKRTEERKNRKGRENRQGTCTGNGMESVEGINRENKNGDGGKSRGKQEED